VIEPRPSANRRGGERGTSGPVPAPRSARVQRPHEAGGLGPAVGRKLRPRFALTSLLAENLYLEPSVAFRLNGPGDAVTFGLSLPSPSVCDAKNHGNPLPDAFQN
jgi:hypothetical protein